jgi:squalene synthase HpnC
MSEAAAFSSGKGHRDENFPVASWLIQARHRSVILAFYRFARAADDVADHPRADPRAKLHRLHGMEKSLLGEVDVSPLAVTLRRVLQKRDLSAQHALDLLEAFRRDVTKLRYHDWDDLMDYCRYSAMPVGRFVLDVHGEPASVWPASDKLCAALQVINHLQDCKKDFLQLNRVYIPQTSLDRAALTVDALSAAVAAPALKAVIEALAARTAALLCEAKPFSGQIRDFRLALEVSVIQRLAEDLVRRLSRRDPLSERVHHTPLEAIALAGAATMSFLARRPATRNARMNLAPLQR